MEDMDIEIGSKEGGFCPLCEQQGKKSHLRVYQINFEEASSICEDEMCTYPLGLENLTGLIVNRNFTNISCSGQRKVKQSCTKVPVSKQQSMIKFSVSTKASNVHLKGIGKSLAPYAAVQKNSSAVTCVKESVEIKRQLKDVLLGSSKTLVLYPQWQNKDALCWLDVVMCLLVHCKHLQHLAFDPQSNPLIKEWATEPSILISLLKAYSQACSLLNSNVCSKSKDSPIQKNIPMKFTETFCKRRQMHLSGQDEEKEVVNNLRSLSVKETESVKTGAGMSVSSDFNDNLSIFVNEDYARAFQILNDARESLFVYLQPKLKCSKGKNDSPVFAIPLLCKGHQSVDQIMRMKYSFQFRCQSCGFQKNERMENILPTLPNTVSDFSMSSPSHSRSCFRCGIPDQRRSMVYESLSDVVMLHFVEGLRTNDVSSLNFSFKDKNYTVAGLVQYRNDPDHFVTWIRDETGSMWLEYDDLKSPVCQFKSCTLSIPSNQIHIVMWEASDHSRSEASSNSTSKFVQSGAETYNVSCLEDTTDLMECKLSRVPSQADKGKTLPSVCFSENSEFPVRETDAVPLRPVNSSGVNPIISSKDKQEESETISKEKSMPSEANATINPSSTVANNPLLMVALTPSGNLVHVPMNTFKSVVPQQFTVNSQGVKGKKNMNSLQMSAKLRASSNTISLLKSIRDKKNSLVKDIEARRKQSNFTSKQLKGRQNTKNMNPFNNNLPSVSKSNTTKSMTPTFNSFSVHGKKFASYKSQMEREERWSVGTPDIMYDINIRRQSSASPISDICDYSAPCSPTLSCHSDSILFQKRKSDSALRYNTNTDQIKRRKSEKDRLDNCNDDERSVTMETEGSQSTPISVTESNGESDVLKDLYNALNMPLPNILDSVSSSSVSEKYSNVVDDIDTSSLDDFLAQL